MSEQDHAGLVWRKSSASESQGSVEVAISPEAVYIRDSRQRSELVLRFPHEDWAAFLVGARNGEFDLPAPSVTPESD